ncbi:MAG: 4Fe-4S dicluster domain-containing protein [Candidatus Helarchaeota archaeon]
MTLSIDFDFRREIQEFNFSLNHCYQCATCSGGCPVAKMTNGRYNPRKIIESAILGLRDKLIVKQEPNVWYCATCQKCVEQCPQRVELTEIFDHVKNICVMEGNYPEAYKLQGKSVFEQGLAVPFNPAILRRRQQLGLPEIQTVPIAEIQDLLIELGFDKIIHRESKKEGIGE